jgi:hypothetical protein
MDNLAGRGSVTIRFTPRYIGGMAAGQSWPTRSQTSSALRSTP